MKRIMQSLGALAIVIGLLKLTPVTLAGQTATAPVSPRAAAKGGPALKTSWGEPDLQGIWTDEYFSPLQRPAKYAGREFLTDAEMADLDAKRAKRQGYDSNLNGFGPYNEVYHLMRHTGRRTALIVDPPDGRMPAYTPEALKRQATFREFQVALLQATDGCKKNPSFCAGGKYGPPSPKFLEPSPIYPMMGVNRSDGPEDHGLIVRCLAGYVPAGGNTPGFSDPFYLDIRRIVQTPGGITMWYDLGQGQGFQRNIVMNGSPHLPSNVRQWWGDSRGHWEGDTLVIDVTNFTAKVDFLGARENLHAIERLRRTGPTTMDFSVTLEDPTTWTRSWTVKTELTKQNEEANRIYTDNRCQEGNYGLPGLLHGARAEDKAFAEGKGPNPATICTAGCGADGMRGGDGEDVEGFQSDPFQ